MDIVRLVDFVKNGELFEKTEGDFDQIVSDFDFGDLENFVRIDNILDLGKVDNHKTTLFILDKLLPENIEDIFAMENVTILDMNFGLSAYGNKIGMSKLDLGDFIERNINIYEPLDLLSLLDNLDQDGNKYIRINDKDLPGNFTDGDVKDVVCMDEHGLTGEAFTIVTTGSMLPEIVRAVNILNEAGLFVEVFVLNKLNFRLNDEIREKITHNKNMVFVLDLLKAATYEDWFQKQLEDIKVKFLYPEYGKLSTVFEEYKFEEAGFDAIGLVERLK